MQRFKTKQNADLFDLELFLGFPINKAFAEATAKLDPKITLLFIGDSDEYLRQVAYQDVVYWGKNIGEICDVDKLELIESNIYSLLKKIVPDYPYAETSLLLFPLVAKVT